MPGGADGAGEPPLQVPDVERHIVHDAAHRHLRVRGDVTIHAFTRIVEHVRPVVGGASLTARMAQAAVGVAVVAQALQANHRVRCRIGARRDVPSWFGAEKPRLRISVVTSDQAPAAFCFSILMKPPIRRLSRIG